MWLQRKTSPRVPWLLASTLALTLLACGDAATGARDTTAADTTAADTTGTGADASPLDADVLVGDDIDVDAVPDTAADDVGADVGVGDANPACSYLDDRKVAKCHGVWTTVVYWSDWGDPSCPAWWQLGTDTVATADGLADAFDCDVDCILSASTAVDFVDCDGHRNGYERYTGAEGCGQVFGTSAGLFTDLCQWAATACQCE